MEDIVVTDGFTLEPDEAGWSALREFGNISVYPRTAPAEMVTRCRNATVIVTNKTPVNAATISSCPHLRLIAVTATGYNIVDTEAARRAGVMVSNVPGYGTESVAQHTIALLLELTNHVGLNSMTVAAGEWEQCPDFCYTKKPLVELKDKVLGIVGYGSIGRKVGEIATALGMKVLYYSPSLKKGNPSAPSLEDVFATSDVVSLHCPLTADNREFVNAKLLSTMKRNAILINTARGQLVNEKDLASALKSGTIAAAALDVLSAEPPPADHPLLRIPNCIITPHTAWVSNEAKARIMAMTIENIRAYVNGAPLNVVNAS